MSYMNRLGNCTNPYQSTYKKVLCVCSAGLLRSPTAAVVLAKEFDYNTRAAGITNEYALIPVDDVLVTWADEIVCMEEYQKELLIIRLNNLGISRDVICLDIKDSFAYRDPLLIKMIKEKYQKYLDEGKPNVNIN